MPNETILHRLHNNGRIRPNAPAYYEKINDHWVPTSWQEYLNHVRQAAKSLLAIGIEPGSSVNILGFNRPEWVIMDLAAMLIGGTATGIYTTNSPSECKYIIEHSEAAVVVLEDEGQWQKINEIRSQIPNVKKVIMMRGTDIPDDWVLSWEAFMAQGSDIPDERINSLMDSLEMNQLCTLIYTSGTTGPPKGVMLSHENLAWTAKQAVDLLNYTPSDSSLSYLPLSHIAEQMFTIHGSITSGYQVYFAESGLKVADNLKEVQPTILFGVPRVWERFYSGVSARLAEATGARAKIAQWAMGVGKRAWAEKHQGREPGGLLAVQYNIANKLFYSKVKEALGLSRLRYGISGAAPLNPEIAHFFTGLDVPIMEIYGQSEGSGPTTTNRPGATKIGTVGQAWPGSEVKLADDGEIMLRGKNVFLGYYKNPAATAETLIDGWLYSGDLGSFDDEGFLTITGRKKEIIITSGGKNVAPKNIEAALKNLDLVAEAVVIGEQRRYLTALLTLDEEAATRFAEEHGLVGQTLHDNPTLIDHLQKEIDEKVNSHFARVEQVRGFKVLPRPFTVEDGELTPTLKIKRRVINEHFQDEIESMYQE